MKWEELTTPEFVSAVEECGGVCLLPLGVIEKHGEHLPLGTDLFVAREIACRAAELEPAIVFPPYFFTQIFEARYAPGTIGIDRHVMYDLLQATCDEIARNGLKKIILVNGHGGNRYFLPHFIMLQLERPKDYVTYLPMENAWMADDAFARAWQEMAECKIRDEHAGEGETSMGLALFPDLVRPEAIPEGEGRERGLLSDLARAHIYNAIEWYADYPTHYAGQGEYGTAAKGQFLIDHVVRGLAQIIRQVKEDNRSLKLQSEFFARVFPPPPEGSAG
jgi:creatinine amidohydrolase